MSTPFPRYTTELQSMPGMTFAIDEPDPKKRIQLYLDSFKDGREDFDSILMAKHLEIISATAKPTATAIFEVTVHSAFCNRMDNMHGGALALVADMCTTMCTGPLATREFWWFGGVSRKLDVTYMRPARLGMRIVVECEVLQIGRRLATIRATIRDKKDGRALVSAEHQKASIEFVEGGKL